jgi:hypothetical protein
MDKKRKWMVRPVLFQPALDDTANNLEDTLNSFEEQGYHPVMKKTEKGFLIIGRVPEESPLQKLAAFAIPIGGSAPVEEAQEVARTALGEAFTMNVFQQLSTPDMVAAKKEAPAIVAKEIKGLNVDKISKLQEACGLVKCGCNGEGCIKEELSKLIIELLKNQAQINLQ